MRLYQIGALIAMGVALLVVFQNCGRAVSYSSGTSAGVNNEGKADLSQLMEDVNNRNLSCAQDGDCVAIAVGAKACGGPKSYLIGSQLNSDLDQVKALALQIAQQDKSDNAASGAVSTCEMLEEPQPQCVNQVCASAGTM